MSADLGGIGAVLALAARPSRAAPPAACARLAVEAGVGIEGDIHADPCSPRQLLLASASVYRDFVLAPHALRENLLLDLDTDSLASGTVLQVGAEARIRVMFQCEACGRLDATQPGLAQRIGNRRGVLARAITGGTIELDDEVRVLGVLESPWSDDWRDRVCAVLDAVPAGMVLEYRQLARLAGIQSSYCRAFPRMLAQMGPGYAAKAVPLQSRVAQTRWQGACLFERIS